MKLDDCLRTRRSIRKYKDTKIDIRILKDIIQLAIMAPSAHNSNPWYFIILDNDDLKNQLALKMAEKYKTDLLNDKIDERTIRKLIHESITKFSTAPCIVVACLDMNKIQKYPDAKRQEIEHFMGIQSVSASIQNLLLAAHDKGIASCWYCAPLFAQEIVRFVLQIPDEIEPLAFITLGYPLDKQPINIPPRLELSQIVFLNKYGVKI